MPVEPSAEISFYIVAHADDWQLFMQPNAYNDLVAANSKVIFIITTAGDAGAGEKYWRAREEGCKSSVRFCLAPLANFAETSGTNDLNTHTIHYWLANNASCYFLRLPDGNLDANGFSSLGYQSLHKFCEGLISTITAADNSTTYNSWQDFCSTLQSIILHESEGKSNILVNYLNPDAGKNPNDHPDHIATGQAIQAMTILSGLQQALFVGYSVGDDQEKLHPKDLFWKAGMFAAYEKAVFDESGYSTLKEGVDIYLRWCLSAANFITVTP